VEFAREGWPSGEAPFAAHALRSTERHGKQIPLREKGEWVVQAWVTNVADWPSEEVSETYRGRAEIEPRIAEAKRGWGLGEVSTQEFDANHAHLLVNQQSVAARGGSLGGG
jgi:hypothetical protein